LYGALFIHDSWTFAIGFVANGILNGTWYTAVASIGQRMLPKAEFAQFSSANALVGSVLVMFLSPAIGKVLDNTHHVYRYTFFLSFIITIVSIILGLILHHKFMALGGPQNYVAPEGTRKKPDRCNSDL
jgi:MFS family permease